MKGSHERPVAAAFGYLINPSAPDTTWYGYTDMLANTTVTGLIHIEEDRRINAAHEYFLNVYSDSRKATIIWPKRQLDS